MHKIKNEKGITLVVLVITIIALGAVSIPVAINMSGVIELKKYTKFKQDIDKLREAISSVYDEDVEISLIGNEYTGEKTFLYGMQNGQNVKNPNDGPNYYVVDLPELNTHLEAQIQLNYGKDNVSGNQSGKDLYIINGKTRTIYYVKGIEYKNEKYHRLPEDFTKINDVYTIAYDANGGTGIPDMKTVNSSGTQVKIEGIPKRSGYKFLGYKIDGDSKLYKEGDILTVANDTILVAQWEKKFKVGNKPELLTGMEKIMFELPEGENKGSIIKDGDSKFDENEWYDYEEKRWANAQTEDGSMWVWIPRFAYKITYNNPNNKSEGGTIDVRFLIETSDEYYDENRARKKAKRVNSETQIVDTTTDYYVHPAFTNESNINYANGGWDKELTGIWVAKFEAGYASGNNDAPIKASSVNYTFPKTYVPSIETGGQSGEIAARNWLDGIYGEKETAIKYPTFQGITYSMNYIGISDAYNVSRVLSEDGNIYGLSSTNADSHLMKNSEWGACTYLAYSQYGLDGKDLYANDVNLNSGNRKRTDSNGRVGVDSVYGVTGLTTGSTETKARITTIEKIREISGNTANSDGVYTWEQTEGQKASCTGNMYGIFDLSGGLWEITASYVPTVHENLDRYGKNMCYDGENKKEISTKYTTVYPMDPIRDKDKEQNNATNESNIGRQENYSNNTRIFGDAVREISTNGVGITSWNGEDSYYPAWYYPFFYRGGQLWNGAAWSGTSQQSIPGLSNFCSGNGFPEYKIGFRPVLVALN